MTKKIFIAVLYIGISIVIYSYGSIIITWIQDSANLILVTLMAIVMALFPIIPYPIIGGAIGAALGPVLGSIVTWIGSAAASIIMFLFLRYGYQEWGQKALHRYKGLNRITQLFERNAFLAILFARMLPFIPSIIINAYAALSRVSFTAYAVSSSLGKIPAMLLFALIGDNIVSKPSNIATAIAIYVLFLLVVLGAYRLWRKKSFA